jgi:hypothetical protein
VALGVSRCLKLYSTPVRSAVIASRAFYAAEGTALPPVLRRCSGRGQIAWPRAQLEPAWRWFATRIAVQCILPSAARVAAASRAAHEDLPSSQRVEAGPSHPASTAGHTTFMALGMSGEHYAARIGKRTRC